MLSWILKDNTIGLSPIWWHVPVIQALGGRVRWMGSSHQPKYVGETSQKNQSRVCTKLSIELLPRMCEAISSLFSVPSNAVTCICGLFSVGQGPF